MNWPRKTPQEIWLALTYNAGTWWGNIAYRIYFAWWLFLNAISVLWFPYLFYIFVVSKSWSWYFIFVLKGALSITSVLSSIVKIIVFPAKIRQGIHPLSPLCAPILGAANLLLRLVGFLGCIYWYIPFVPFHRKNLEVIDDDDKDKKSESKSDIDCSVTDDESKSYDEFMSYLSSGSDHSIKGVDGIVTGLSELGFGVATRASVARATVVGATKRGDEFVGVDEDDESGGSFLSEDDGVGTSETGGCRILSNGA